MSLINNLLIIQPIKVESGLSGHCIFIVEMESPHNKKELSICYKYVLKMILASLKTILIEDENLKELNPL